MNPIPKSRHASNFKTSNGFKPFEINNNDLLLITENFNENKEANGCDDKSI